MFLLICVQKLFNSIPSGNGTVCADVLYNFQGIPMKYKITLLLFLFLTTDILTNPIDGTQTAKFSELVFDENNEWKVELFLFSFYPTVDSIIIQTKSSKAKVLIQWKEWDYRVITQDSLSDPLFINSDGDSIMIMTYSSLEDQHYVRHSFLRYGDGSSLGKPIHGYSISRIYTKDNYNNLVIDCLTKRPSLGMENVINSLCGYMKGKIYDADKQPVTNLVVYPASGTYFELFCSLNIHGDGTYDTKIFRRSDSQVIDHLIVKLYDWFEGVPKDTIEIESFTLNDIKPDTTVVQDIYLKSNEYVVTGVVNDKPLLSDIVLINYPNPFNSSTNFYIRIPAGLRDKTGSLNIYNSNGQLLNSIKLENDYNNLIWNGTDFSGNAVSSGVYYYKMLIDRHVIKNGSMILLK